MTGELLQIIEIKSITDLVAIWHPILEHIVAVPERCDFPPWSDEGIRICVLDLKHGHALMAPRNPLNFKCAEWCAEKGLLACIGYTIGHSRTYDHAQVVSVQSGSWDVFQEFNEVDVWPRGFAFSMQGDLIFVENAQIDIRRYDMAWQTSSIITLTDMMRSWKFMSLSPDGRTLALSTGAGIVICDISKNTEMLPVPVLVSMPVPVPRNLKAAVEDILWSPGATQIVLWDGVRGMLCDHEGSKIVHLDFGAMA